MPYRPFRGKDDIHMKTAIQSFSLKWVTSNSDWTRSRYCLFDNLLMTQKAKNEGLLRLSGHRTTKKNSKLLIGLKAIQILHITVFQTNLTAEERTFSEDKCNFWRLSNVVYELDRICYFYGTGTAGAGYYCCSALWVA